jgi:hypothetical protein
LGLVAGTPVWSMNPAETGGALVAVTQLAAQVARLQMRLLAHAERVEVGAEVGATSAANWLAHQTKTIDPGAADAEEARRLQGEEDDARAKATFTMSSDGHGKVYGPFTLPPCTPRSCASTCWRSPHRSGTPIGPPTCPLATSSGWRSWTTSSPCWAG